MDHQLRSGLLARCESLLDVSSELQVLEVLLYLLRFLVGTKSDLRDPHGGACGVNQERALSFARAHNMTFFETSAKSPPGKKFRDGQSEELRFQQDAVEDIVVSVGAKLKRQQRPSGADPPGYGDSFKVTRETAPEKEAWTCC